MINKLRYLFLLVILLPISSCLEDDAVTSSFDHSFDTANLLLQNFEQNGDFINNELDQYFISASELNDNIETYLIIDVRDPVDFSKGRIKNSINIQPRELVDYLNEKNTDQYQKVVFVSSTGQKAAFCFSILKLLGYNNLYILNFGLASWNSSFADVWINALDSHTTYFEGDGGAKNQLIGLPELENINVPQLPSYIENKAKEILQLNFDENNIADNDSELSISWIMTDSLYYFLSVNMKGDVISVLKRNLASMICFGNKDQFAINGSGYLRRSHPSYAWLYKVYDGYYVQDFRSDQYLQNIPHNTRIIIYSYNGQRSAMAAAYLRMLGYNACSMVFGSCNIQYNDLIKTESLLEYTFTQDKIGNYEYVTD